MNRPVLQLDYEQTGSSGPKYDSFNPTVLSMIPSGVTVLDVGCATGALGSRLGEKGCRTIGLEIDPSACRLAAETCDGVVRFDVTTGLFLPFRPSTFDYIVFADILEHLLDPGRLLSIAAKYLRPGGKLVISTPNIAHWRMRLSLLRGRFDYTDYGILDKTHLRFFTKNTLRELIAESGYDVVRLLGHGWHWANVWKGLLASAFVVVAEPNASHLGD